MAIAYVSQANGTNNGASTVTISYTQAAGSNNLLIGTSHTAGVAGTVVSGMTFNGAAFTAITDGAAENSTRRVEMWYLANPSVGTFDFVITLNQVSTLFLGVVSSFTGVHQLSSARAGQNNNGSGTAGTLTYTLGQTNDLIVSASRGNGTNTPDAPQTTILAATNAGVGYRSPGGAGSDDCNYTFSGAGGWGVVAAALIPAVTGFGQPLGGRRNNPVAMMG